MLWAQWCILISCVFYVPLAILGHIINAKKPLVTKQISEFQCVVKIAFVLFSVFLWFKAGAFSLIF